jgi:trigger factor
MDACRSFTTMAQTDPTVAPAEEQGLPEPTITLHNAGPARKKLSIEIPQESIAAKLAENFESLQNEALIPGFRRGHVPQKLLEKRFGSEIRRDACSQLVGEAYTLAVEKHGLRVLGEPHIPDAENLKLPESGSLAVEIEVEVVPEFAIPELKGIEVRKPPLQVTDADVVQEIERYRQMYGQHKPAEKAEFEDYITADVTIRSPDDQVLHEAKGVTVVVPGKSRQHKGAVAGIIIEDLGKRLEGARAGDSIKIDATGPERHEQEKLAGQPLNLELNISRIERLTPMALEELVTAMGMDSEDSLRKQVREILERRAESEQRRAMAQQVLEKLMESVELELPERLSARKAENIFQRRAIKLMQRGATREEIEQNLADLRAASEKDARDQLKQLFILDAVARQLEVEVSEGEVNGRIVQMAMYQGIRPERLREQMRQNGQLDTLYVQVREEKAIARILQDAKISEVPADEVKAQEGKAQAAADKPKKPSTRKKTGTKAKKADEK